MSSPHREICNQGGEKSGCVHGLRKGGAAGLDHKAPRGIPKQRGGGKQRSKRRGEKRKGERPTVERGRGDNPK